MIDEFQKGFWPVGIIFISHHTNSTWYYHGPTLQRYILSCATSLRLPFQWSEDMWRAFSKWSSHNRLHISGYASITLDYTTPHSHDILLNHDYGWVATISFVLCRQHNYILDSSHGKLSLLCYSPNPIFSPDFLYPPFSYACTVNLSTSA